MLRTELESSLAHYLAADGWQAREAVPFGVPSVLRLLAAQRKGKMALFHSLEAGKQKKLKLDADQLADLKGWSERNDLRTYIAVLFGDRWVIKNVGRLRSTWIERLSISDDGL
ncbi:MAG: hypothetical protein QF415_10410 [Candidatus Undinarchaeales archaeon]|nr:hypothetical protein [Candidatus Undinarchaeales archaeon]MDP7493232.1 hypothetical protein [Candidatus Undinarchaeales archaeon]